METKDRIRAIMEDQKMTQQEFADFLQQAPATLSSIFNGRTHPTLKVIDAIKKKIPDISIEWLLYGLGDRYATPPEQPTADGGTTQQGGMEPMLNFDAPAPRESAATGNLPTGYAPGRTPHPEKRVEEVRIVEKEPRRVTEIRVYYDDQTYETFLPSKK